MSKLYNVLLIILTKILFIYYSIFKKAVCVKNVPTEAYLENISSVSRFDLIYFNVKVI